MDIIVFELSIFAFMKRLVLALATIICFCACRQHTGKPMLLRMQYEKGYRFNVKYRMYIVTGNNNDAPLKNDYVRISFKVDSVINNTQYLLSGKYDYIRTQGSGMLDMGGYSSDKDEKEMGPYERNIHQRFKPLLDSSYRITIGSDGKIVKPFSFAGGTALPEGLAPIDYENMLIAFPKEPVYIGDEWTVDRTMPVTKVKQTATYKLRSVTETYTDSVINIGVTGKMTVPGKGSQDFYGEYYLNAKTKQLQKAEISMRTSQFASQQAKAVIAIEVQ